MLGILNFVIFGWPKKIKDRGATYPSHCPHCNNSSYWRLLKTRRWISLYFIPLIPLGRADYHLLCPVCEANVALSRSEASVMKDLQSATDEYRRHNLSEQEYQQRLADTEQQVWDEREDATVGLDYEHAANNEPVADTVEVNSDTVSIGGNPQQTEIAAGREQSADPVPDQKEGQAVTLSNDSIADVLSPKERRSVQTALNQLDDSQATTRRTIQGVYEQFPAGYGTKNEWWDELVEPVFSEHPDVERLDTSGYRWQLTSTSE